MSVTDHPLRYQLSSELHARPFPTLQAPCTAVMLALKHSSDAARRDRAEDLAHLCALLDRYAAPHPNAGATHHFCDIGRFRLKWENHTEFTTYTIFKDELSERPFDPAEFDVFPTEWLRTAPGERIASAIVRVVTWEDDTTLRNQVDNLFVAESVAVSRVLDNAAVMAGDFHVDMAGHMRFLLSVAPSTGPNRIGRIVQRIFEIETYKAISLLGLSRARTLNGEMGQLDEQLNRLSVEMSDNAQPADATLNDLLSLSARLEMMMAHSSFRFSATRAYEKIVHERIDVLQEQRFQGFQTFYEFMMRRYEPAIRTVRATEQQLHAMAERARRAGELLRTRVDVERSAQNQALLESMDQRADLQLRLQHTVEGLSVVAISYYAVSLVSYLLYPLADAVDMSKGTLTALVTLPVIGLVWWMIKRIKKKIH